jgi:cytochrome P450
MTVSAPPPVTHNPFRRIGGDLWGELRTKGSYPPGPAHFSIRRTRRFVTDPLPILLSAYEEYGPIFSLRVFHERFVFMLGPAANHYVLVSHASSFHWREGDFGQMIPLLGDGLLTIDGDYHRRARRIMLPAFHTDSIAASVEDMANEADRAVAAWRPGDVVDVYHWARELAMRIAMRALLGLDPDSGARAAFHFERALSYYGTGPIARSARGPGTAWRRMVASRRVLDALIYGEIARRRRTPEEQPRDILGMLLAARDEDGSALSDDEVRHQAMTLMFAGHDTATSTISFLLYELARHPHVLARLYEEQDRVLGGAAPTAGQIARELPELDMALDETLRLYPPAWVGPRRAVADFEFEGHRVPAGTYVAYSSWASHRLPEVFPEPEAFLPERFTPERKAKLPKGAYVPFGAGSRTCIGMRFGQMEIKAVISLLLRRFRLELSPGRAMRIRQMPTLSPRDGLPMIVRERGVPDPVMEPAPPRAVAPAPRAAA